MTFPARLGIFAAAAVHQIATITGATYVASFQAALVIVLAEGVVFLVLTVCNIREMIVGAIPYGVRMGIAPAIGIGLISFTVINICTGKASRHFILTYILALVFLVKFFLVA